MLPPEALHLLGKQPLVPEALYGRYPLPRIGPIDLAWHMRNAPQLDCVAQKFDSVFHFMFS
jgi:hypothetical protein